MVLGFNHNIRYKGEVFHVQTEDSGKANPHIITLLYRGGTILASAKTSYADIIKVEQLEQVVESIMKEQHKDMMRRLKAGEFDARAFPNGAPAVSAPQGGQAPAEPVPGRATSEPASAAGGPAAAQAVPAPAAAQPSTASQNAPAVTPASPGPPAGTNPTSPPASPTKRSLDEVILDYLITGEEK